MTCRCRKKVLSYGIARCKPMHGRDFTCFYEDDASTSTAIVYRGVPFTVPAECVPLVELEPCTERQLEVFWRKHPDHHHRILAQWMISHDKKCAAPPEKPPSIRQRETRGTVTLTRSEADALRDLLEYVRQGWVGPHAQTIRMLRGKVAK